MTVEYALDAVARYLREVFVWVALSLAGGTLFALKRGHDTVREWCGVLLKSLIVGVLASRIVMGTTWADGWGWIVVAAIAFGADAILYLVDAGWTWVANNPHSTLSSVIRSIASGRFVEPTPRSGDDDRRRREKMEQETGDDDG